MDRSCFVIYHSGSTLFFLCEFWYMCILNGNFVCDKYLVSIALCEKVL